MRSTDMYGVMFWDMKMSSSGNALSLKLYAYGVTFWDMKMSSSGNALSLKLYVKLLIKKSLLLKVCR
jgi:hypothetical protein